MRKRTNAASVWITARRIGQSCGSDHEGGFLSVSGGCENVLVNGFAAAAAGAAGVAADVAVFEGAACNSSSWGGSCCNCYSHRPHHHAGSVHVGRSPALGP